MEQARFGIDDHELEPKTAYQTTSDENQEGAHICIEGIDCPTDENGYVYIVAENGDWIRLHWTSYAREETGKRLTRLTLE